MTTHPNNSFIGYSILMYCSMLLVLIYILSQLSFEPEGIVSDELQVEPEIAVISNPAVPIVEKKTTHTKKHRLPRLHKKDFKHPSFAYNTNEPETYKKRPIPKFREFKDPVQKKKAFIAFFKELINEQNTLQLKRREQLAAITAILKRHGTLDGEAQKVFDKLCTIYRIPSELDQLQSIAVLDLRVNAIPGSIVLAQAASESAWGTSRFAVKANNFFGQWCFTDGCGIVPSRRLTGATHEIALFTSAESSVRAYFKNLNTYKTYKPFRDLRLAQSKRHKRLSGLTLAEGLKKYSERGQEYVNDIKAIITFNHLDRTFNE